MTRRHQKHILKAAKSNIEEKFQKQLLDIDDEISALTEEGGITLERLGALQDQRAEIEEAWSEWKLRAKKNKGKIGRRVLWTGERDTLPKKTIKHDVLWDVRAKRKEKNKPKVGVSWLHEGALVTKRGSTEMMIVTRIGLEGETVEVLRNGAIEWHRNVSLRPADWMMED
jgi:hypothetical protein